MAEIARDDLERRKQDYINLAAEYTRQVAACEGAAQAIEELINSLFPADALTIPQLGEMLGAKEISEPEAV